MKKHFINRLKIIGFVFALVGWFMLITVPLEEICNLDLSVVERVIESKIFSWGINIIILLLLVFLINGQEWLNKLLSEHNWIRIVLKILFAGGVIGWGMGLGSLIL